MEIIIHGKPNSVGHKSTNGIDPLFVDKIEDVFFRNMSLYDENESMYVDVWKWKNKWYSVYTYLLYSGIRDTADRQSYFALSLVIPEQYCCLVSEVYNLLKAVTSSKIIGGFIDKKGKYIVDTFQHDSLFESVINEVSANYVNLAENFDNGFKPQLEFTSNLKYSLKDCDSKAFVDALKQYGRVIVSESAPSKDSLLAENVQARQELSQVKSTIREKEEKIDSLNKQLNELTAKKSSSDKKKDDDIAKLKSDNDQLKKDKNNLLAEKEEILEGWKGIEDALTQFPLMNKGEQQKPAENNKNTLFEYLPYVPLLNAILIGVLAIVCLFCMPRKSKVDNINEPQISEYQISIRNLQDTISELRRINSIQENTIESILVPQPAPQQQSASLVEDCALMVTNNSGKAISEVKVGDTILVRYTPKPKYKLMFSAGGQRIEDPQKGTCQFVLGNVANSAKLLLDYRPDGTERKDSPNAREFKITKNKN